MNIFKNIRRKRTLAMSIKCTSRDIKNGKLRDTTGVFLKLCTKFSTRLLVNYSRRRYEVTLFRPNLSINSVRDEWSTMQARFLCQLTAHVNVKSVRLTGRLCISMSQWCWTCEKERRPLFFCLILLVNTNEPMRWTYCEYLCHKNLCPVFFLFLF